MADIAVSVEGIGKRYQIGERSESYGRLSEALSAAIRRPLAMLRSGRAHGGDNWIWALRDVSFEVGRGEVIGVIGRNGSGKSTLLKVLSRITSPTEGKAVLRGRVGSLLEVGTGFHPELSGRENVFLSGAVLGMPRAEISRKFDEIVDFAGIGPFLDTPVKRYSSGMQVRLGFAVAAHLDPEILFIDEVLAVGDADFQAKCLGKMSELGEGGRTIVFVSHSMPAVLRLCSNALLLDHGRLIAHGPTSDVIRTYLETDLGRTSERQWRDPIGDDIARLHSIRVVSANTGLGDEISIADPIDVEITYWSSGALRPAVNFHLYNGEGVCLFAVSDFGTTEWEKLPAAPGLVRSTCRIPGNFLAEGRMTISVAVDTFNPHVGHAGEPDAVAFQIVDRTAGSGVRGVYVGEWPGVVRPMLDWNVGWTHE